MTVQTEMTGSHHAILLLRDDSDGSRMSFETVKSPGNPVANIETPARLYLPDEIVAKPCPVPTSPGTYGWYFRKLPGCVPVEGCITHEGFWLLYVGISPRHQENAAPIRENLRTRIRYHLRGNAEGSTLRRTLGCLLQEELGIALRRVGSGKRLTFSTGENCSPSGCSRICSSAGKSPTDPGNLRTR